MLLVSCNSTTTSQNSEATTKLKRDLNPQVTENELATVVKDNNKFAYKLFKNLDSKTENIFFSPISISHALMMVYAGSDGETKEQMKSALNITLPDDRIHKSFNN